MTAVGLLASASVPAGAATGVPAVGGGVVLVHGYYTGMTIGGGFNCLSRISSSTDLYGVLTADPALAPTARLGTMFVRTCTSSHDGSSFTDPGYATISGATATGASYDGTCVGVFGSLAVNDDGVSGSLPFKMNCTVSVPGTGDVAFPLVIQYAIVGTGGLVGGLPPTDQVGVFCSTTGCDLIPAT